MRVGISILLTIVSLFSYAQGAGLKGVVSDQDGKPIPFSNVYIADTKQGTSTDINGEYSISNISAGTHKVIVSSIGYLKHTEKITFSTTQIVLDVQLKISSEELSPIDITDRPEQTSVYNRLKNIDGVAIYAAKKNEVIELKNITANLSSNNARQVFARVPGVVVWENDCAGLQLGVGARGLSPNRTSNFNTRQNGYDMAADALGYPESYYAPPMQAIDRIEIVRGAASLQYGTQFGGMINLKLKEGNPEKKFSGSTMNTYNFIGKDNGYFNTFNEAGGQIGKLNYYTFINFRKGDCNCPNSDFSANTNYAHLGYKFNEQLTLKLDYTNMQYLAQQPGGLTDALYDQDPYQSFRTRNFFYVNWNLIAADLDFQLNERTALNSRTFTLIGSRKALGIRSNPGRIDNLSDPRDLLVDYYRNVGNETRLLHKYKLWNKPSAFLVGFRAYRGYTEKTQGYGSNGTDADFEFETDSLGLKSDYKFPSYNIALFSENIFNITDRLSLTPGVRYEYIRTTADGFYDSSVRIPNTGEIVIDSATYEIRQSSRSIVLFGLGLAYRLTEKLELYSNFSQNYRAITFNDMRVVSPSAAVDPNLQDESGFNLDLGVRGELGKAFTMDAGLFWLSYNGRIGSVLRVVEDEFFGDRLVRYTTNVADANILGTELYLESDLMKLFHIESKNFRSSLFVNFAYIIGTYHNSEEPAIEGNQVEEVPKVNLKTGWSISYKDIKASLQYSFVSDQYSEATNAETSPTGIYGIIPAYDVLDLSLSYSIKMFNFEGGINNITNNTYFTRRADGYPGPGIITAAPRSIYVGVGVKF
ncbi:TonB-dependent receptor [Owenweeksia hongkongensis]|nr:TonB-dependent receptor [Owenweeksia hongkongensis]